MRKADLVKRLRDLQGEAYGAYAVAVRMADKEEKREYRYPVMVGSLHWTTEHLAKGLDALATDVEREGRRSRLNPRVLVWALLIGMLGTGRADVVYDAHPSMGALTERNHTPCGADAQAWLLGFVANVQIVVLGKREHIHLIYADATHLPSFELGGEPLMGFWRQGGKTVFISLEGDTDHPRLDIAFILRGSDGTPCHETWEGLGLRR